MAFNRRLFFWIIKEYIKRSGKIILIFFVFGIFFFFVIKTFFFSYLSKMSFSDNEKIGLIGSYTLDNLPNQILDKISNGLTKIGNDGKPLPDLAKNWEIKDNGKTYIFYLKENINFSDGFKFTSSDINYSFSKVKKITPNKNTIIFELDQPYTPFLNTVSKPIFKQDFLGTGAYKVTNVNFNGEFITSISLKENSNHLHNITYYFYPTSEALKIAFMLGEINKAENLPNLSFKNTDLKNYPNLITSESTNYSILVTAFYNNSDSYLSDKRVRDALAYALPNSFTFGERAHSPFPPTSWAYIEDTFHTYDLEHSKLLLKEVLNGSKKQLPTFTVYYFHDLKNTAEILKSAWKKIGINVNLVETYSVPVNYQIFLGYFNVPSDPDQYTLWHSDQPTNITNYKNLRIDQLLEDGRRTLDIQKRLKIYADFQKYLLDDQPASFLYFPYEYKIVRK